ncbi:MAG: methylamine utilization protein, partial [Planctomycetota bacterium]
EIKGLPTDRDVTFRVNHELGKFEEVMIDGKKEKWKSNRFELELKPGMNDLGAVMVGADNFEG